MYKGVHLTSTLTCLRAYTLHLARLHLTAYNLARYTLTLQ